MAKTQKRSVGDTGEGIVCRYLEDKGFSVLERNYLRPWGEIDIVASKGDFLHFVEVKSVTREPGRVGFFRPEENMHKAKIKRLHRAIQTYLLEHKVKEEASWQMDLVCVYINFETRKAKVELFQNIV